MVTPHPISIEMLEEGHLLLLGTTGAGKTYQLRGLIEQLRRAERRVGAIDKLGNHWGLTLTADGEPAAHDFVIFGGDRAHVPMQPDQGAEVGRLFVERNIPAIFDVSLWKAWDQQQWVADFADAVFLANRAALHLAIDEAQSWVPQGGGGEAFGSILRLAEQGRGRGIRLMMAAQRLSRIDKSAANQAAIVIAMRQTGTADRKAIRDLVAADDVAFDKELPGLPTGTGFVWDPMKATVERVAFPPNTTFDSSRTPRHGDVPVEPAGNTTARVEELRALLAPQHESESQKSGYPDDGIPADPAKAYAKGGEVGRMLRERDEALADLHVRLNAARADRDRYRTIAREALLLGGRQLAQIETLIKIIDNAGVDDPPLAHSHERLDDLGSVQDGRKMSMDRPQRAEETGAERTPAEPGATAGETAPPSPETEYRALAGLAAIYPAGLTEKAWAARTGYSAKGGAWVARRKRYTDAGFIERRDGLWHATAAGVAAAGQDVPRLPSPGDALVEWWAARIGAAGRLLRILHAKRGLTRDALAAEARMSAKGGTFSAYVGELRRADLITERGKRLFVSTTLTGEEQP